MHPIRDPSPVEVLVNSSREKEKRGGGAGWEGHGAQRERDSSFCLIWSCLSENVVGVLLALICPPALTPLPPHPLVVNVFLTIRSQQHWCQGWGSNISAALIVTLSFTTLWISSWLGRREPTGGRVWGGGWGRDRGGSDSERKKTKVFLLILL